MKKAKRTELVQKKKKKKKPRERSWFSIGRQKDELTLNVDALRLVVDASRLTCVLGSQ